MKKLYGARLGFVSLDSARQSRIEAGKARGPNEEHHSQIGKGDEDQFCKVAASPNSHNLSGRGIILRNITPDICIEKRLRRTRKSTEPNYT